MWGPGDRGVYELLCQFDASSNPLWIVQDEGGDVIGAVDNGGLNGAARNVAMYSYGPYGEVVQAASLQSHSPVHAGHKGLFVDRLDAGVANAQGVENPRLVKAVDGGTWAYNANNRHLLPKFGRWAQMDPNASGLGVLAVASDGRGLGALLGAVGLDDLFADTANLYEYGGSNPSMGGDPMGTSWWDDTKQGADVVWNAWQTFQSFSDPGGLAGSILESMVTNYSMNLESDSYWTDNWDTDDTWHSRGSDWWVTEAILLGAWKHFNLGYWYENGGVDQSNEVIQAGIIYAGGKTAKQLADSIRKLRMGMVFESYYLAKTVKSIKCLGSKWDAHHLLPRSWARVLGVSENGPAVLLTKEMHQPYTNQLNKALKELRSIPMSLRRTKALEKLREIYRNAPPDWMEQIENMLSVQGR